MDPFLFVFEEDFQPEETEKQLLELPKTSDKPTTASTTALLPYTKPLNQQPI